MEQNRWPLSNGIHTIRLRSCAPLLCNVLESHFFPSSIMLCHLSMSEWTERINEAKVWKQRRLTPCIASIASLDSLWTSWCVGNNVAVFFFCVFAGRFQKFDYGPSKNMKLYKSRKPPEYNLSNVKTKVHIIYGTNDYLVDPAVCCARSRHLSAFELTR